MRGVGTKRESSGRGAMAMTQQAAGEPLAANAADFWNRIGGEFV
jgi:hypothetical protein